MEEVIKALATICIVVLGVCALSLFMAFPMMWCWNYAVVAIFGLKTVTWGQAWCLMFLSQMLIKSTITTNKSKE